MKKKIRPRNDLLLVRYIFFMTTFSNHIRSVEDCYMGSPIDEATVRPRCLVFPPHLSTNVLRSLQYYLDFGKEALNMEPQLCDPMDPMDLNCWSFSPLPSPESPYLESPLSGTFQGNSSWDTSGPSFGSFMTPASMDAEFFSAEALNEAANLDNDNLNDPQQTRASYVAPAITSHPPQYEAVEYLEEPSKVSSEFGSPNRQSNPSSPLTMQPAWGTSLPPRKSSSRTSRTASKHTRSYDEATPTSSKSSSSRHRLRSTSTTTTAASSRPSTASTYSCNSPPKHARLNHNQIEKQYRNRLNGQFETLLLALPREEADGGGEDKKFSKAEVLMLARKHIRELERERRGLEAENERLGGEMNELRKEWVDAGGVVLP